MSSVPPPPAWHRRPEDGAASEPARKPKRRKRRRGVIQIDTGDEEETKPTIPQRIAREFQQGGSGYLASLGMHFGLMLILALLLMPDDFFNPDRGGEGGPAITLRFTKVDNREGDNAVKVVERKPIFDDPRKAVAVKKKQGDPGRKQPKLKGDGPGENPANKARPVDVNSLLQDREPKARERILEEVDPKKQIRRAISNGLNWLKRQQESGGRWRLHEGYPDPGNRTVRTDTGATALALLAFLGDGHTNKRNGPFRETVQRGLTWLVGVQKPDGDFHDHVELGRNSAFYAHAQATIVLCEAYAMTKDDSLRKPAERGIAFLVQSQQPVVGGWKYQPQQKDSRGDLSVTGWCLMALHSARAAGLEVPRDAFRLSSLFLDSVQEQNGARYKYEAHLNANAVTPTMTAEGLLCRQFLGWPRDFPALRDGAAFLMREKNRPAWIAGGTSKPHVYYWYYAGHVLHNQGGGDWKTWYADTAALIVQHQSRIGGRKRDVYGSWDPKARKGGYYGYGEFGGRLYMTTLSLLVLEMPYRHRSVYSPPDK